MQVKSGPGVQRISCQACKGTGTITIHTFGLRVLAARKKNGLLQKELAKAAGVTQSMVSRIEAGQHLPNIETARKIAEFLGSTPRKLVYPLEKEAR